MNTALLRTARWRKIGSRTWQLADFTRIHFAMPSKNVIQAMLLEWSVTGGKRGLNVNMHRKLSRATALDLIHGTNTTACRTPL